MGQNQERKGELKVKGSDTGKGEEAERKNGIHLNCRLPTQGA